VNIEFTAEQQAIRDAVLKLCAPFDDAYWLNKDTEGGWPHEFHKAFADAGFLGIAMPKEYHVERYLRESFIPRIAPVSRELILCHIAEKVLGLPKSY